MTPRFTGYLPSTPDPNDFDFANSGLYGVVGTSRPSIDATEIHVQRYQNANSCVGYTTASAIGDFDLLLVKLGLSAWNAQVNEQGFPVIGPNGLIVLDNTSVRSELLPLLSGLWNYTGARRLWFKQNSQPIPDTGIPDGGSSYRDNIMTLRDVENGGGARADSVWPETPENIPKTPPANVDQADPLVKVNTFYRIRGEGDPETLRNAGCAALAGFLSGQCMKPMMSLAITQGFGDTKEGEVYDPKNSGPVNGSHALLCGGFDGDQDAFVLHHTWKGVPATIRVRVDDLANPQIGGESWVMQNMIYIPRRMA